MTKQPTYPVPSHRFVSVTEVITLGSDSPRAPNRTVPRPPASPSFSPTGPSPQPHHLTSPCTCCQGQRGHRELWGHSREGDSQDTGDSGDLGGHRHSGVAGAQGGSCWGGLEPPLCPSCIPRDLCPLCVLCPLRSSHIPCVHPVSFPVSCVPCVHPMSRIPCVSRVPYPTSLLVSCIPRVYPTSPLRPASPAPSSCPVRP